ncbi:ABC transporter permease [Aeromonas hydrophila]|uniref:ABC transporter permease n=1 Tax=Aeromonas hydrophila TaxID=644 RepID=A0A926FK49_AERHY|nr:ABC transporter permease [Aeromonas hydrophila]
MFLTAIMLMYLFSIQLGWLPAYGRGETYNLLGWESGFFTWDGIKHLILPLRGALLHHAAAVHPAGALRDAGQLSSEYVKFARAKGLDNNKVYYSHALKNTMLPVITVGGVQIGTMVAYTILTERVPVAGDRLPVPRGDPPGRYALITAYVIFVGLIFVVTNTLVDLLYGLINPTVNLTAKG